MKKLGDGELDIMLAVWEAGEPVTSTYVQGKLQGSRDWTLPAVVTSLNRLVEKGFLTCEKRGRGNLYTPLVSERAYKASEGRGILDRLFGGSFRSLTAALYDGEAIGEEDLRELRSFLDDLEGK